MRAVVVTPERGVGLTDVPEPTPGPGQVLVAPEFCGICGSDLHTAEIDVYRPGVVMGHEFAGRITEVGVGVEGWEVGQAVVANPNGNVCGECRACRAGRTNLCRVATREQCLGVARDGGLAAAVALDTAYLHALPEGLSTRHGAWVEPLAVALRAVRTSPMAIGDTAAVIGGGPVGQLVVQLLRAAGATRVLVVEPSPMRRSLALHGGADEAITPDELAARLADGGSAPIDHVWECSGHPTAVQTAIDLVEAGGSIRLVGMSPRQPPLDSTAAIMKELRILGGFIYIEEFAQAIDVLARGAVDVDVLTSRVVDLEDQAEAFTALRKPDETVKVLLSMPGARGG